MDTQEPPSSVDKADRLVLLCYRVCTLRLAVQILCITFAEVTYNERNTEATASVVNTQLTTVTLPGHRGKPRLGSWVLWVLTNRHFGQSGNLSEMTRAHRWCASNKEKKKNTSELPLTPSEVKNRQFYARGRKKRLRLTWLAGSHRCSVKTHDKPVLVFHLANTTAELKQVWQSYAVSTDLCFWLPYSRHRKSWTWDLLKLHKTKQSPWKASQPSSS